MMMTCRLLCALLVLALCFCPSVCASESETAQVEDIVSGTYSPSLVPGGSPGVSEPLPPITLSTARGAPMTVTGQSMSSGEVSGLVPGKGGGKRADATDALQKKDRIDMTAPETSDTSPADGLLGNQDRAGLEPSTKEQTVLGTGEGGTTVSQSRTRQPAKETIESVGGLAKTTKTTAIKSPEGASQGDLPAKATDLTPSPPVEGPLPNADKEPVPQPEEDSVSMKPNKDLAEEDIATTVDTDQNETSSGRAESTTTTTLVASDNANNEADRSTGEGIPNNTPDSDVSGTEERRDENKYNNTKETRVQVADIKSVTVASGNSDSSTAVSHTSPLLLLLVVAATVVAA
ncbi:Mucin-associated surface protein (MASP) [Trypanosoma cruzi]|uniref:Mucin-associated surface protein (MASP), putative n=2 Tax=Trypanosoma cruzi TaxID=5693 RepID=Q4D7Z3_TRYCC|nr:mucin-associated surface protein (MASP), putative [Trypanosoma cruzi]EAN88646.1 mucin-associated surface protein (MASP), putative [Trypanosoma cruzi]PWV15881.1 Mucin-associated surface protein (MASP) [Trypanosoma cruzi]|eukprot:XP_810497.1 mucin-associated surface protein (MASP) [Trypanosoma cruzi strain CL Brener]